MKKEIAWQEGLVIDFQQRKKGTEIVRVEKGESKAMSRMRVGIIILFFGIGMMLLTGRLAYLQIWEGGRQLLFAKTNHIEILPEEGPRGIIFDTKGIPLVRNVIVETDGKKRITRSYPLGSAIGNVVGYLSEANQQELGCREGICYTQGAMVGRAGIEQLMETKLKGRDGGKVLELEATGTVVREVGYTEPAPGESVVLTIDSKLQEIAYRTMANRSGAVVALDMQGKVLALVSSPSFDPNIFTINRNSERIVEALTDKSKLLLLNRAIGGAYAPGSVFKLVTAYAGLIESKISPTELIEDTGEIKIDKYRFGNWYFDQYGKTEGMIDVRRALSRSNDIFFYHVGERLGIELMDKWGEKFGAGKNTGIELKGEVAGIMPTPLWKERKTGEPWFTGNTYHLSIGQGDLLMTPIQVARMTVAAVSGRLCQVNILAETATQCQDMDFPPEIKSAVIDGMKGACATGGTAFPLFDFQEPVLCKTGTAQHANQQSESDLPHAWITVAYPAENPEMILTVFVEAGGEGSAVAGGVAREVLDEWLELP